MGISFLKGVSRRNFIKIAGSVSAVFAFASPVRLLAGTANYFKPVVRNDLDAAANSTGSTGMSLDLVNFSQVSDVHITDISCHWVVRV